MSLSRNSVIALLLAAIIGVFLLEAHARRLLRPTPTTQGDQESYLRYARRLAESNYTYVGGRNRMPIFPTLLSLFYRPGMTETQFLARAQSFNVNLSGAVLLALFFLLRRYFPAPLAVALVAMTAFGVLVVRAPLAQVEVLFYLAFFSLFLACCRMLRAPGLWLGALSGALAGLTFLLKASVLPALGIFTAVFAAKAFYERAQIPRRLLELGVLLAVFLALVWPYISTSKRIYGHYFYNVNSTFYFWCDSWPEARAFSKRSGDLDHWPTVPPEEIPSARKYWREHSLSEIAGRLFGGMLELATHNARLDGYYKYALFLGASAFVLAFRRREEFLAWLKSRAFLASFVVLFLGVYFSLFAWYTPLSADSRFLLTLFLPAVFTATYSITRLQPRFLPILTAILFFFACSDAVHRALQLVARESF